MKMKQLIGVILAVIGGIGEICIFNQIVSDKNGTLIYYTYTAPLTQHEQGMIALCVIFAIVLVLGIIVAFLKKGSTNSDAEK